ncbi:hypothetical protein GYMLUDRAFT_249664 [Collybiopsis luxurians FD-317 M1]|uniref:Uncharacterized protein n=1 Tax=Collybiopsis luxurians FD-317 M1 TaxID=944289 RepID=A0A0D0C8D4_9AGAR|nr:hypothetical protein GYMLUDRAFT_249664 [Collybiopsis luxurians FD-317 M1]
MSGESVKCFVSEQERRRQEQECQRAARATRFQRREERCGASTLDDRSVSSAPARGAIPSRTGEILEHNDRNPFDLENPVEHGSPHVLGHLVSTPYVLSRSQRGQPYHMAARADSRLAMRPTQSAPITPEKGREQETIHLSELTHSPEDPRGFSVGVSSTRPFHTPTHPKNEDYYEDIGISPTTRYTSIGARHKVISPLEHIRCPLPLTPREEESKFASQQSERETSWGLYSLGPLSLRGPRSPFNLKRSTPIVESDAIQAQGLLSPIPDISRRTVSSLEQSSPLPAPPTTEEFVKETQSWNHESSLMSPPYPNVRIVPSTELTHQLVDLLQINQCTRFELIKAMQYYIQIINGRDPETKDNFWVLAAYFWKCLMQRPSQLPNGINNEIFQSKEVYEGALWLSQLIMDPERMEMVNEATMRLDNEERKMLNSPTLSLLDKVEQGRSARADDLIGGYSYTSQFWDQQKIAQVAKEYRRSMGNTTTPSYEDLEESRRLPPTELDRRLLIVPEERGEHRVRTADGVWELKPSSGKSRKEENEFFSERTARRLALQNASDTLMSAINPRDEDICLAKQYKERIHGDKLL